MNYKKMRINGTNIWHYVYTEGVNKKKSFCDRTPDKGKYWVSWADRIVDFCADCKRVNQDVDIGSSASTCSTLSN